MKHFKPLPILLASITFLILTLIVFYYLSTRNTSPANIPLDPSNSSSATDPVETPSSSPVPLHISDSQALAYYNQGLELYNQHNFPEALVLFNQALAIDPQCYEALNAKGATLAFQGQHDQGLALIQQALEENPLFVYGHFNRGLANELAGRWDPAIEAYQRALQLDNQNTWSYYGIASIYGRLGDIDKVLEYLESAISLNPDVKEVARGEHDFAPVREDPRFQALVKP